eukprot:8602164-Alexandrium_andersonii.AAC.1
MSYARPESKALTASDSIPEDHDQCIMYVHVSELKQIATTKEAGEDTGGVHLGCLGGGTGGGGGGP